MIRTDVDAGAAISSVGKVGDSDPADLLFSIMDHHNRTEGADSSGNVGIGTTSPDTKLQIDTGSSIGTVDNAYSLAIRGDGIDGIQILSDSAYSGRIVFGDQNSNTAGQIRYDHSTDAFRFFTNGTEKVSILSGGQIQFNAYGSGTFTGTATQRLAVDSSGNVIEIPIGSGPVDGSGAANKVTYWTDTDTISYNNNFHWDNTNGNLGVGTATPAATVQIVDSTSGASVLKVDGTNGTLFEVVDDLSGSLMSVNDAAGLPVFEVFADNHIVAGRYNQNDFYLNTSGNLGLGTSSPITKLNIKGDQSADGQLYIEPTNDGEYAGLVIKTTRGADRAYAIFAGGTGTDDLNFRFRDATAGADRMVIDSSGKVGIGTASPEGKLHVFSASAGTVTASSVADELVLEGSGDSGLTILSPDNKESNIFLGGPGLSYGGILRWKHSDLQLTLATSVSNAFIAFYTDTGTERMRITSAGSVGIGTTTPSYGLDIRNSTTSQTGALYVQASLNSSGKGLVINSNTRTVGENAEHLLQIIDRANADALVTTVEGVTLVRLSTRLNTLSPLQVNSQIALGGSLYTFSTVQGGADLTLTSNANPANIGVLSNIKFKLGSSGGGGPNERMRIQSDGSIGVWNTTDIENWAGSSYRAIEFPRASLMYHTGTSTDVYLNSNAYYDGAWKYKSTAAASQFILGSSGDALIRTIASGTIDTGITWTTPFIVKNNGNVGIGTTDPSSKLEVVGNNTNALFKSLGTAGVDAGIEIRGARNGTLDDETSYIHFTNYDDNASPVGVHNLGRIYGSMASAQGRDGTITIEGFDGTNYQHGLTVDENGKVGIGTVSPSTKLDIVSAPINAATLTTTTCKQLGLWINPAGAGSNTIGHIYNGIALSDGFAGLYGYDAGGSAATGLGFFTGNVSAVAERMRIDSSGNVGIGTTSPSKKLDVNGDVKIAGDTLNTGFLQAYGSNYNVGNNNYGVFLGTYSGGTSISPGEVILSTQGKTGWDVGDGLGRIRFFLGDSSGVGVRDVAKIEAVNELGNGSTTTTAAGALAFHTSPYNSQVVERLRIKQSGEIRLNAYGVGGFTSGTVTYRLAVNASGDVMEIPIGAGPVDGSGTPDYVARWTPDDNTLGIGKIRDDNSTVAINTAPDSNYMLKVGGNGYFSGTLTEASSLAIKENIENFTPSIDKINKIRPVKYNKKGSDKKEIGLIAEELEELFPELVEKDENGNPSGVNYSRAVTVLLGGFKELYKELQEIKKRI
jgi:hypothetical protein